MSAIFEAEPASGGVLAQNILYFARALRETGFPSVPAQCSTRWRRSRRPASGTSGFFTTLHAVFVKKHEHTLLFDQAFRIFWKRKGFLEKLIAMMSPQGARQDPSRRSRGRGDPRRRRAVQAAAR